MERQLSEIQERCATEKQFEGLQSSDNLEKIPLRLFWSVTRNLTEMEGLIALITSYSSQASAACTFWELQHRDAGNPALKNLFSGLKLAECFNNDLWHFGVFYFWCNIFPLFFFPPCYSASCLFVMDAAPPSPEFCKQDFKRPGRFLLQFVVNMEIHFPFYLCKAVSAKRGYNRFTYRETSVRWKNYFIAFI